MFRSHQSNVGAEIVSTGKYPIISVFVNRIYRVRSSLQVRQWQHWGSGCYEYRCENGRLHIKVGNYSYECFHAGQELAVRILRLGWLHRGSLKCPPCKEICQSEFEKRGEYCKMGDEAPPNNFYQRDELQCGAAQPASRPNISLHVMAVSISLGIVLFITSFCLCSNTAIQAAQSVAEFTKKARDKITNVGRDGKGGNGKRQVSQARFNLEEVVIEHGAEGDADGAPKSLPIDDGSHDVVVQSHATEDGRVPDERKESDRPKDADDLDYAMSPNKVVYLTYSPSEYHSDSEIQIVSEKNRRRISHAIRSVDDYANETENSGTDSFKKSSIKKKDGNEASGRGVAEDSKKSDEIKRRRSKDSGKKDKKKDKFNEIDLDEEPRYFELDEPIAVKEDPFAPEKRCSTTGLPSESNKSVRR